jgi:acylphosphatase
LLLNVVYLSESISALWLQQFGRSLPSSSHFFPEPPHILQKQLLLSNVNASLASLSGGGFRLYIKGNAEARGLTGSIQRYHGDDVLLHIEGTESQFDEFDIFLQECVNQDMIGDMTTRSDVVIRRRSMTVFKILKDHTRLFCASRRNGVRTGKHSGGDYEKKSEFSADSSEIHFS